MGQRDKRREKLMDADEPTPSGVASFRPILDRTSNTLATYASEHVFCLFSLQQQKKCRARHVFVTFCDNKLLRQVVNWECMETIGNWLDFSFQSSSTIL